MKGPMRTACWLALALPAAAVAQTNEPPLSADDVVRAALNHSPALRAAAQETLAAQAAVQAARAQTRPTVDAQARAVRYEGLRESSLGPSLTIPELPARYTLSVGLTQPLYAGGRLTAARAAAGSRERAARDGFEAARLETAHAAWDAYWNWSRTHAATEALQAAVRRMETLARDTANLRAAGLATDNDALATDVRLEQTRLRLAEAERRIERARSRMIFLTGLALTGRARPQLPPSPADDVPEETDLLRAAAGRPERRAAQQSVAAAEQDERAARGASRPDVFALARVEEGNPNGLFFPPEEQWQADAFVGVALSWNLFDSGLARSRTQAAATRAEQARLRLTELDDLLALDARDSRSALLDALDRVRFAGRVLESARRNLATATDLWRNGLARHADVLDAHSQLTDAEYQVSSARADAALARGGLARAAGRMPPVSAAPAEPTP